MSKKQSKGTKDNVQNGGGQKPVAVFALYVPSQKYTLSPIRLKVDGVMVSIGASITLASGKVIEEATQAQYQRCFEMGIAGIEQRVTAVEQEDFTQEENTQDDGLISDATEIDGVAE